MILKIGWTEMKTAAKAAVFEDRGSQAFTRS
jgi:hypothetical protein